MNKLFSIILGLVRKVYQLILKYFQKNYDESNLSKSTIVFAPHQDDETLGCGGTIIRKKQAGANIKIVFMTDGSGSHSHLIPRERLKAIRAKEALAAAQKLGVEKSEVIFLEFTDGNLSQKQDLAISKVKEIIKHNQPEEIFIPYSQDGVPDHDVTNSIVLSALKKSTAQATIYEYPVWFWNQFPWTGFSNPKNKLSSSWLFLKHFRCHVDISSVLEQKKNALQQHKSQIERLIPHRSWSILADVSQGEFLNCFLQDSEYFYRH